MELATDSEVRRKLRESLTFCRLLQDAHQTKSVKFVATVLTGQGASLKRFSPFLVTFLIFSLLLALNGLDQFSAGEVKVQDEPRHFPCRHSSSTDPSTVGGGCTSDAECQVVYGSNSYCIDGSCALVDVFCPEGHTYDPHTGQCYPQEQWFQYQTKTTKTDTVKARVTIRSDVSGVEVKGTGSFQISMDDSRVGSITSGQTGTAKVYAGTCYQTYLGSTTGYTLYQGEQCENVVRQHKVELELPVGPAGDQKCPTGGDRCFLDPGTSDIRYYLVSDPVQYKGDGETAEFIFKIEFLWRFATVDQNANPIDLTRYGFGYYKSDGTGPLAEGSEFLKEGTTVTPGFASDAVAETSPRSTRYVYDHVMVLDLPSDVGRILGPREKVVMDGPKLTWAFWQRQYYLTVDGECLTSSGAPFTCGNPTGTGYYNEDATATYSVDQRVRDLSWMGTFGGYYLFDQWRGDSASRARTDTIVMNSAKRVTAVYIYIDTEAIRNIGILVSIGVLPPGVLIWVITRRRRRQPPPPPPRFPPPGVPPRGFPPGAVPPGGWPPGGWPPGAGPSLGGPGWTTTPTPPRPPGLGPTPAAGAPSAAPPGTTGPGAGRPPTGPGTGGPGTGGPGAGVPTGPGAGRPPTGPVTGGPRVPGAEAGPPGAGREAAGAGREGVEVPERPTEAGALAAAAAGLGAAGIGAVALARRRRNKCVWCGSKIKRDQIVCPRCGVHQECPTCGTPLHKASIVSKGYSGSPEDQGLFCDNCNTFTS